MDESSWSYSRGFPFFGMGGELLVLNSFPVRMSHSKSRGGFVQGGVVDVVPAQLELVGGSYFLD